MLGIWYMLWQVTFICYMLYVCDINNINILQIYLKYTFERIIYKQNSKIIQ